MIELNTMAFNVSRVEDCVSPAFRDFAGATSPSPSSSSMTCGAVAPKFILGSDSCRARCPKRRNSRSDICRSAKD